MSSENEPIATEKQAIAHSIRRIENWNGLGMAAL